MASKKKPLLSLPSNAQLVSSCREVQNLAVEAKEAGILSFLDECQKSIFFQLPKLNNYWLGD